jgi:hypothetical protein
MQRCIPEGFYGPFLPCPITSPLLSLTFDSYTIRPKQIEIPRYAQIENHPSRKANHRLLTVNCSSPPNCARGR